MDAVVVTDTTFGQGADRRLRPVSREQYQCRRGRGKQGGTLVEPVPPSPSFARPPDAAFHSLFNTLLETHSLLAPGPGSSAEPLIPSYNKFLAPEPWRT
jgi:hypothetical protein